MLLGHKPRSVVIEISLGELIDKITILEIKQKKITNPEKLTNINLELSSLMETYHRCIRPSIYLADQEDFESLKKELSLRNLALWDLEDEIRIKDREQDFGAEFVRIVRAIYRTNDERAYFKQAINKILRSYIVEEKSYEKLLTADTSL
jgi:hypothetical protein